MATSTRNNAWNNGGTFNNSDLLWYAQGVGVMQSRSLDDPSSWWFFAAIHGQEIALTSFPGWGFIPGPPQVPTTPLPSRSLQDLYWDQCQHQSWFFPPWHRGYLLALEAQIRAAIVGLGGPETWALPYWNYFGPQNQFEIPPAFTQGTLPDGTPNPLFLTARYGPNNDGNIFIPIPPVSQACQSNDLYTGSDALTSSPGFGGPQTGFSHAGDTNGNLEDNPHNQVHGDVGGNSPDGTTYGLMADPNVAALDPVFYLHHSNIDRMWAAWNAAGNANPTDPNWLNGSPARAFAMPMPDGTSWVYTPADMDSLSPLGYTYDDLSLGVPRRTAAAALARRLHMLAAAPAGAAPAATPTPPMPSETKSELLGAHEGSLRIKSSGARATVRLQPEVRRKLAASLEAAAVSAPPDRVYLQLENVRGTRDANKLAISVNGHLAGTVALFGLRNASSKDGRHGGSGLNFLVDISGIVDALHVEQTLDADALDVRITPTNSVPAEAPITVGRVGVYRESQR